MCPTISKKQATVSTNVDHNGKRMYDAFKTRERSRTD